MAPTERWVNAVCEIVVPMDIDPDASRADKLKAAEEIYDMLLTLYSEHVATIRWEDAHAE